MLTLVLLSVPSTASDVLIPESPMNPYWRADASVELITTSLLPDDGLAIPKICVLAPPFVPDAWLVIELPSYVAAIPAESSWAQITSK